MLIKSKTAEITQDNQKVHGYNIIKMTVSERWKRSVICPVAAAAAASVPGRANDFIVVSDTTETSPRWPAGCLSSLICH